MSQTSARSLLKENIVLIAAGVVSLVVVDILQLLIPRVTKHAIDDLAGLTPDAGKLLEYALLILLMASVIAVFRYAWRRCLIGASRKIEQDLRDRVFFHLQTLDAAYFDRTSTGDLMARVTNDINHIRMASGFGLVALTDAVFLGTAAIGFMAYINVHLTLYSLIPMPLIVIFTRLFGRKMHRMYQEVQAAFSDMTEIVRERFSGIRVIKAFARQNAETALFQTVSERYIRKNMGLARVTGAFFPLMVFFANTSTAIVLCLGGRQAITAVITPGDFVAFISYLGLLTWPMMALGWVTNLVQRGRASLDRINQVLAAVPGITDGPDAVSIAGVNREIVLDRVSFIYPGATAPALKDIGLTLPAGKTTFVLGPPGSGKTTLAGLLARKYDPDHGAVRIDGRDIRHIRTDDLRRLIAFMPQEPFLFSATIKENITFDDAVPDDDPRLVAACRDAGLYKTIRAFPGGFDTLTGEKGVILSGGQKQRVALARAFYHAAPVLILDDPVSQVDPETADEILAALRQVTRGKTVLLISHRPSLARFAESIVVLRDGRITEHGDHEELLRLKGYYAEAWRIQQLEERRDE
ncbi:MAG: ABC transporter ATP-binding protein [Thermodesulfobacteriota bacterium]